MGTQIDWEVNFDTSDLPKITEFRPGVLKDNGADEFIIYFQNAFTQHQFVFFFFQPVPIVHALSLFAV